MDPLEGFTVQLVPKILVGLACYIVRFGLIAVGLAIILAGIIFIFSRGNPTAFANAKKNLLYVIIGGLVIYGVYTIILSVSLFVTGSTTLPWVPINCGSTNLNPSQSLSNNTSQVLSLSTQINQTPPGSLQTSLLQQLGTTLSQRQIAINNVIQSDPTSVWNNLLTSAQINSLPLTLQSQAESPIALSSIPIDVAHVDDFTNSQGHFYYMVDVNGQDVNLYVANPQDPDFISDSTANINGYSVAGSGIITDYQNIQILNSSVPSGTGTQNVLVALLNSNDYPNQPITTADAQQFIQEMNNYYRENSYSRVSFNVVNVAGWYTFPRNLSQNHCSQLNTRDVFNILRQNGTVPGSGNFNRILVFIEGCSGGWGTIGRSYKNYSIGAVGLGGYQNTYNIYKFLNHVLYHEMGHNFGVYHANSWDCASFSSPSGQCHREYGNNFDTMGNGSFSTHFNIGHKDTLGWVSPQIINKSGRYRLNPIENGPNGAVIIHNKNRFQRDYFFLEYRIATAYDGFLSNFPNNLNGLLVNWRGMSFSGTRLLDLNQSDPSSWILPVGSRFVDSNLDLDLRVISADPFQIVFDVSFQNNPIPPPPQGSPPPPPPSGYCGDGTCDASTEENTSTCFTDCGISPPPPPPPPAGRLTGYYSSNPQGTGPGVVLDYNTIGANLCVDANSTSGAILRRNMADFCLITSWNVDQGTCARIQPNPDLPAGTRVDYAYPNSGTYTYTLHDAGCGNPTQQVELGRVIIRVP